MGLAGYYGCFVQGFGKLVQSLTKMLKMNSFHWSPQAVATFISLKSALITTPMLHVHCFTVRLAIECDALGEGVGIVLRQKGYPLAYFNKCLTGKSQFFLAYDRSY